MSRPIRILVVEDSEDDAKLAMRMLRVGGFAPTYKRVQDLESFNHALAHEAWDAVLSDFRLPGFSGVDALEIFRRTALDIPFIFCSGTIGEETAVAAMKAGASDYVMKGNLARLAPVLERELAQAGIRAQHRQGQIDLELSRDRYMDLYDSAPVGYLTLSAESKVVLLNLTAAEMLGAPREQLAGSRFIGFVSDADKERWLQHLQLTLVENGKHKIEIALDRSRCAILHVQLDCMRVTADGAPMVRVAMSDITERKEAEAGLRKFEAQLRHVQKMESIGTLAGGIAHDFNNILGAILGNVALARDELGEGHSALTSLDEIHKASLRARNLVQQILTFSRREPQQLLTQPLRPVVEETHKLLRAILPAGVELDVRLAEAPVYVHADTTQIQQVLMNLCTNAWHALKGDAGRIGIGLEPVQLDNATVGMAAGRYAHLWVSDNGVGMDAATRERIFEPFFTTKPIGQGTGLGLSVVHGIVSSHHGAIKVDSERGRGSTFHLYLPAVQPEVMAGSREVTPARVACGRGERVLYIDDDEAMVMMVERVLQRGGYRGRGFADARRAIAYVNEHPDEVDVVVTDFNMPALSGLEVARALLRVRPTLPIVISSGYITEELRSQARRAGVRGLLEKQNTFQELVELVAYVLATAAPSGADALKAGR